MSRPMGLCAKGIGFLVALAVAGYLAVWLLVPALPCSYRFPAETEQVLGALPAARIHHQRSSTSHAYVGGAWYDRQPAGAFILTSGAPPSQMAFDVPWVRYSSTDGELACGPR
jgi:hypothetical protein